MLEVWKSSKFKLKEYKISFCILYNIIMEKSDREFIKNRFSTIIDAQHKSESKLSREMGQSPQYLNQIVNGYKLPSLDGLYSFCSVCNITLKEFFDDEQQYPSQYKNLMKYLNKLSSEELEEITTIVKRIVINKK